MSPRMISFLIFFAILPQQVWSGQNFPSWVRDLRQEALDQGIGSATLDKAFAGLVPLKEVLERQQRQPETSVTLEQYLNRRISPERIAAGRQKLTEHRLLLERISRQYRVQPRFIVALWGLESDYGRNLGKTPVVAALATLAYAGKRSGYFRRELLIALRILDQGHISPDQMTGSWAGAMGQCQFMPWNFSRRAVDFDGDGRRDIWNNPADVLASIANFLSKLGWRDDLTWGRQVVLTRGIAPSLISAKVAKNLEEWQQLGVRRTDGRDLPQRSIPGSLIRPPRSNRVYLVYANFPVLLKWNNSSFFGISVGQLADRLED